MSKLGKLVVAVVLGVTFAPVAGMSADRAPSKAVSLTQMCLKAGGSIERIHLRKSEIMYRISGLSIGGFLPKEAGMRRLAKSNRCAKLQHVRSREVYRYDVAQDKLAGPKMRNRWTSTTLAADSLGNPHDDSLDRLLDHYSDVICCRVGDDRPSERDGPR